VYLIEYVDKILNTVRWTAVCAMTAAKSRPGRGVTGLGALAGLAGLRQRRSLATQVFLAAQAFLAAQVFFSRAGLFGS
jgi:MYXO-CTERM domain-containing protein